MTLKLRATIALAASTIVLLVAAFSASGSAPGAPAASEDGSGTSNVCIVGATECDDTPAAPPDGGGGSIPGDPGDGTEPGEPPSGGDDHGGLPDQPCGVEVVEGDGPDGTVSYTPCDTDVPPEPFEPTIVEPTPGMANVYARPFDSATASDDGLTVAVDFYSGVEPCYVLDHVDVAYGPNTVTITLFEGNDPSSGDVVCIEIAMFKRTLVQLDEPLGDRRIVDGAA